MTKKHLIFALAICGAFGFAASAANPAAPAKVAILADDDDEEEPPYVEEPFTVSFTVDRPDVVSFTVNDQPVSLASDGSLTVDPGDGYIKAHIAEGYAFTRFEDTATGADYLQYVRQTSPVTVRKYIKSGMDEADVQTVDGHAFLIETFDMTTQQTYTLTVDVDNASMTQLALGTSRDFDSGANRTVSLVDGLNTITYTEGDAYLIVRGLSYKYPLTSVTFNGRNVPSDGQMNAEYSIQLRGAATEGSTLVVKAYDVTEGNPYSFTANIDDARFVRFFSRMPADKSIAVNSGENTIYFSEGDTFEVWCTMQAATCTFNGEVLAFDSYRRYRFTPTDGGILDLRFDVKQATMTVVIDSDSDEYLSTYMFTDGISDWELGAGRHTITFMPAIEGDFYFRAVPEPRGFYHNGESVEIGFNDFFIFTPADGDIVRVYMQHDADLHEVTFNVDDAVDGHFTILREGRQTVDHTQAFATELTGTEYHIIPDEDTVLKVTVDSPVALYAAETPADNEVPLTDGMYKVTLTDHTLLTIADGGTSTGITAATAAQASASAEYYNLQGIRIAAPTTPGLYLLNGRKVVIK